MKRNKILIPSLSVLCATTAAPLITMSSCNKQEPIWKITTPTETSNYEFDVIIEIRKDLATDEILDKVMWGFGGCFSMTGLPTPITENSWKVPAKVVEAYRELGNTFEGDFTLRYNRLDPVKFEWEWEETKNFTITYTGQ